jgi:hypothetical protein
MLSKGHLKNCYNTYHKANRPLPSGFYLGYMEACLVAFGVIESKQNGFQDYVKKSKKKFLFLEWEEEEGREQIVIRLAKEYLEKQ